MPLPDGFSGGTVERETSDPQTAIQEPDMNSEDQEILPGVQREALGIYLAEQSGFDAPLSVDSAKLAGQGMSDDTILIEAHDDDGQGHSLAIRRYRPEGVLREVVDPERHYRTLAALDATPIPTPEPLWFDADSAVLHGTAFAMQRVPGFVPVPWSPEGRDYLGRHSSGWLSERFVDLLVDIHALDWRTVDFPDAGEANARERTETLIGILAVMYHDYRTQPEPILADAIGWLRNHTPTSDEVTLVHGDYRTGNLVFDNDDIMAILDWEFALLGDPMRDVAWVLASSNRVDSDLACYLIPPERFVERYESKSGRRVDWSAVRFWQVYYQVFNALTWVHAGHRLQSGKTRDLRMLRWSYTLPVMRKMLLDAMREATC